MQNVQMTGLYMDLCAHCYAVACDSGALASFPFSFILLLYEPAEVTVCLQKRFSSLRTGLASMIS